MAVATWHTLGPLAAVIAFVLVVSIPSQPWSRHQGEMMSVRALAAGYALFGLTSLGGAIATI